MRIAVLVPAPDYPEPWAWAYDVEAAALRRAGAEVEAVAWTDPGDLSDFDLVLPLVAWGYHLDYSRWLDFLDRAARTRLPLVNSPAVLRWNSDKAYLAELGDAGVPTVPTMAVESCSDADLEEARRRFGKEWLVIKPPVSASATGTHRLGPTDDLPRESVRKPMILQPLIEEIARTGEFSLMLFDGEFSHAVVKRPKSGDFRVQPHLGGVTLPSAPPAGGIALAQQALAAAPVKPAYARVDMVPDDEGTLRIMELELIEPACSSIMLRMRARRSSTRSLPPLKEPLPDRRREVRRMVGVEPRRVDLGNECVHRTAPLPRGCLERRPEHRLETDGRRVAGDEHRPFPRRRIVRHQYMCWPPLIDSVEPVTNPAFSSHRKATPRAISSALPRRPTGIRATIFCRTSSGTAATMSVSMYPGAIAFTVTPDRAPS
jgi:glutathione synthase/RimK-type ligase-like ATP-grasp enzyme